METTEFQFENGLTLRNVPELGCEESWFDTVLRPAPPAGLFFALFSPKTRKKHQKTNFFSKITCFSEKYNYLCNAKRFSRATNVRINKGFFYTLQHTAVFLGFLSVARGIF
jgi:hypothetical protein